MQGYLSTNQNVRLLSATNHIPWGIGTKVTKHSFCCKKPQQCLLARGDACYYMRYDSLEGIPLFGNNVFWMTGLREARYTIEVSTLFRLKCFLNDLRHSLTQNRRKYAIFFCMIIVVYLGHWDVSTIAVLFLYILACCIWQYVSLSYN